ncbi:3-hydroxyacyl-CoA dehydrogenase family protein [Actinomycetospora endophytica]|uniref:3-hydroxyacyl-CoA dehydrogenase family protein n=1 Tax=Actinomycetospora endophytica TaxID=2291215 RepID=A0ABS8PI94_9PSEU|nr:3-hydroxyacyl-CoA dehydrogenase family protein [Actinomycetospora endophytica]MCD2197969.1 3-hydroxyacyl-CoA dehydrogenase family protein [Actinomycetospora endophytica]
MSIAVIGGGTMGQGIAYVFAAAGIDTTVVEPDQDRAAALIDGLVARARTGVAKGRVEQAVADGMPGHLQVVGEVKALDEGLELVIESVPEIPALKTEVLTKAEARSPRLLATNTSSISVDSLAAGLSRPQDFLGMHFFNPVWSLPLVEIVRGAVTSDKALATAQQHATTLGKESIVVADVPGFATSRLDNIAAFEAMRMLEEGVATAEDIDRAAVLAYGHPIGPLRLSDVVGLDVRLDIARLLEAEYGERYAPPAVLERHVAEGRLGRKTGHGFYDWS